MAALEPSEAKTVTAAVSEDEWMAESIPLLLHAGGKIAYNEVWTRRLYDSLLRPRGIVEPTTSAKLFAETVKAHSNNFCGDFSIVTARCEELNSGYWR